MVRTLVIDDCQLVTETLAAVFAHNKYENIHFYNNVKSFFEGFTEDTHIVVVDYMIPNSEMNGIDILKKVKSLNPNCYVIMLSSAGNIDIVIEALEFGIWRYVCKDHENWTDKLLNYATKAKAEIILRLKELREKEHNKIDLRKKIANFIEDLK